MDFRVHTELHAFEKANDPHPMRIGGLVSSDTLDAQGERIIQAGLDFSEFLDRGWYNDNHGKGSTDVVGYPEGARYVKKGGMLPTGKAAGTGGWWTEGYLLNTEKGRQLWELASALEKAPRKLGFSIEGKVVERDSTKSHIIKRAMVRNVAVTHCPVNRDTELVTLAKALTAGSSIEPGTGPGDGSALRTESLDDGEHDQGGQDRRSVEQQIIDDLGEDGANGGLAKAADDFAVEFAPDTDEIAHAERFAGHARRMLAEIGPDDGDERLTRSEASRIILGRFPMMPSTEVDRLIKGLASQGAGR